MPYRRHSRGATVRLFLDIIDAGAGVISQAPTIAIQRASDGRWFQASDSSWTVNKVENPMAQTDSTNLPGRYHFDFDQSKDDLASSVEYIVKKANTGPPVVTEYDDLLFEPVAATAALELCSVQGTIATVQGKPRPNALVRATLVPVFKDDLGRSVESDVVTRTYTNAQGDFDLPLIRGATFRLEIPDIGFDRKAVIPDQSSVLFTEL